VKKKRLARTAPVPCVVRTGGIAEEDSLAENVQRAPLHPLDQFRAFLALREKGQSEEDIAAAFFVSVAVVRQRRRLAAVSPKLLEVYAEDGMSLEQLMAFTVNPDHARQAQVWEALLRVPARQTYQIRRMLTEDTWRASDRRARFVGIADYEAAGGIVLRDLFESDDGGWLQDRPFSTGSPPPSWSGGAETVRVERWKVEVAPDFPYGHTYGLRRLSGKEVPLTKKETKTRDALKAELDNLEKKYADSEEIPEEADARLGEIETALGEFEDRPVVYDSSEIARAGVFISIGTDGTLHVERGYVRPEDEEQVPTVECDEEDEGTSENSSGMAARPNGATNGASAPSRAPTSQNGHPPVENDEEDEGFRPLSDRLMTELTSHRTVALREAVANDADTAYLAILHALCLKLFYRLGLDSCLEVDAKSVLFGSQVEGLGSMAYAAAIDARHGAWSAQLPKDTADLWDVLCGLDSDSRQALFAHCVGLTINATCQPYDRRPKAIAHADHLAEAVQLDMAEAGWRPTVATYLGRVTKARILEAVREAKGEQAAQLIEDLKKADMAREAERLLDGTGWLPEPLRLRVADASGSADTGGPEALPAFLTGDTEGEPHAVAAE
jgi:ParB family transcriptional regulator, chromosome partitioning protein